MYIPKIGYGRYNKDNPPLYRHPSERYQINNDIERDISSEDVQIHVEDGVLLRGWLLKQPQMMDKPTVIFFHENAGNLGSRLQYFNFYYNLVGCNILAIAYRGYGESSGTPTEQGIKKDALAIMNYAFSRMDINPKNIFLHGRSLGGAVATFAQVYATDKAKGVILENTFTSMEQMVKTIFPQLALLVPLLVRNKWYTEKIINKIEQPIHFIRSTHDQLVPDIQMQKLVNLATRSQRVSQHVIQNGTHNDNWTLDYICYFKTIKKFIWH